MLRGRRMTVCEARICNRQHNMSTNYQIYLVKCVCCGANTSKKYAKAHEGKCKACATGVVQVRRKEESAEARNARLIDNGYQAYAREEGYYDGPDV